MSSILDSLHPWEGMGVNEDYEGPPSWDYLHPPRSYMSASAGNEPGPVCMAGEHSTAESQIYHRTFL